MPYVHTIEMRVRHYECDAYGRLNPAVMLGYLQEAAFAGSAAVGYSATRYAALGLGWFAYETEIAYLRPLGYGDSVEIRTWVQDFRRVRSLRRYEVLHGGVLAAEASTDWVLIDTRSGALTAIPPEIVTAYARGEAVAPAPPRPPFPLFPPAPADAVRLRRRVEWRDLDPAGHVNNAVYVHYAQDAEQQALEAAGWPPARLREAGAAVQTYGYQIEYKVAAQLGDSLVLTTWITDPDAAGGQRCLLIQREADGKLLARVRSRWGWADATTGTPRPQP